MMVFANGRLCKENSLPGKEAKAVYFIKTEELAASAKKLQMENILLPPLDESAANRFESHRGYDCVLLNIPDSSAAIEAPPLNIDIYYTASQIIFIHDTSPVIDKLIEQVRTEKTQEPLPQERVLPIFFNLLTEHDSAGLEATEETIASLEDMLATDKKIDYTAEISTLRKRLLKLKRYYESLFDSLVDMEENQNRFLSEGQLRYIHIVTNRADRLLRSVLNLRDYVTQVREAYQAQMDISLNQTMKLFTVITAIFLPLTLIAGWYGMNLSMPEYLFPYSYPIVIGVSLAIAAGSIVYFKKNNWF